MVVLALPLAGQTAPAATAPSGQQGNSQTPAGQVLFQSHGTAPVADADRQPMARAPQPRAAGEVPDRARAALTFTAYDLDLHLVPARREVAMRARLSLRNEGAEPLTQVPLQISSTLHWDHVAEVTAGGARTLEFAAALVDTDADHTGRAAEALITLPRPLAAGAAVTLEVLYGGTVPEDAGRLTRLGASVAQATATDWDSAGQDSGPQGAGPGTVLAAGSGMVALRGFGNVLWYPVAAPPLFLGDGAALFQAIGRAKLREQAASVRLRLAVEYAGEAPAEAFFCGRRLPLRAASDQLGGTGAADHGVASAEFAAAPLGFRTLSLFVPPGGDAGVGAPARPSGESSSAESSSAESSSAAATPGASTVLVVEGGDGAARQRLEEAAQGFVPLLSEWLGPRPRAALTVIDHPGQPFQDGPLVVAPVASLGTAEAAPALLRSLAVAWAGTGQSWMDEGLAEFLALVWTEQTRGREAALLRLNDVLQPLAVGEPAFAKAEDVAHAAPGQPLIAASEEVFYRRKAAGVWWMLRDVAGAAALKSALAETLAQPASPVDARTQAVAFEKRLEHASGRDLGWFFNDWVLRDVGLPDLTLVDVTPRPLPAGKGHDSGWLVAVTIRNEGAAAAEVPLVIHAGTLSTTHRVRVPGLASVTERVVVEAVPTSVTLNDGGTPEVRSSMHARELTVRTQ